jgi:hypothetical protein
MVVMFLEQLFMHMMFHSNGDISRDVLSFKYIAHDCFTTMFRQEMMPKF